MQAPIADPVSDALNDNDSEASRTLNKPIINGSEMVEIKNKKYNITNKFPREELFKK